MYRTRAGGRILSNLPWSHLFEISGQSDHFRPVESDARHGRGETGHCFHRHRSFRVNYTFHPLTWTHQSAVFHSNFIFGAHYALGVWMKLSSLRGICGECNVTDDNCCVSLNGSRDLSQSCAEYAVPSLCFAAFPLCDDQSGKPVPRQLCRDECEVLENDICRLEYAIAKQHPLIGEQVRNMFQLNWNLSPLDEACRIFRLKTFQNLEIKLYKATKQT